MVRAKNTKPEILTRSMLHRMGYRFRKHVKELPGKPDIVLPKYHTAIFVNGCFWHGHQDCNDFTPPKTRTQWWLNKINRNIKNDNKNMEQLIILGWQVLSIWECQLTPDNMEITIKSVSDRLKISHE